MDEKQQIELERAAIAFANAAWDYGKTLQPYYDELKRIGLKESFLGPMPMPIGNK